VLFSVQHCIHRESLGLPFGGNYEALWRRVPYFV
jgi:hypothetical protein